MIHIRLEKATKTFKHKENIILILDNVSWNVSHAQMVTVVGPSGSGKTTLLHILVGLEPLDEGEVWIDDKPIHALNVQELRRWRNESVGLVYQHHLLLEELTAFENIALRAYVYGMSRKEAEESALYFLERVGLKDRMHHRVQELSGGELQRVALARALVTRPQLLFADEPTGNLDEKTALTVFELLQELVEEDQVFLFMVTHNLELARRTNEIWYLHLGTLTRYEG